MKIDKQSIALFRDDFKKSIKELESKYNIKIGLGNISYSNTEFHGKLSIINNTDSNKSISQIKEETEFLQYYQLLGFKKEDLGGLFTYNGQQYKLIGCRMSSRKYPIIVERTNDNKQFKLTVELVKSCLE